MVEMTPEQDRFLREHDLCVLATGRRDGSPQVSTVYYHFDGTDLVISATTDRWKYINAMRQPRVAILVNDGRRQLIVYGRAEGVPDDPERRELTKRVRAHRGTAIPDDETLSAELTRDRRAILRVIPERVRSND
ncbi:MAG: TIGR03618 family F420-dependent PPOX class oxidoreductase [Dehalococcoidia bacterium]|nr:TIGR03618 family F420-dependent PPOX class oxidoreductase [Dehalococcoidia bacterium]